MRNLFLLLTLCLGLTQCVSTRVTSVASSAPIRKVYVVNNPDTHMAGFQPELVNQIQQMGYATEVVDTPPAGNPHYVRYTAIWRWDMAMYLHRFDITLFEGTRAIGTGNYFATGLDLRKFGPTKEKIRPVLKQLFGK